MSVDIPSELSPERHDQLRPFGWWFWVAIFFLLGVQIALTSVQRILPLNAMYDDQLFFSQAVHIANGEWLGPYNDLTLIKGPFYPVFLATCHGLGLPMLLAERLLYGVFCIIFILALRPVLRNRAALLAIYALLLFNPGMDDAPHALRIYRDGIYPALTGLVLACAFALLVRRSWGVRRLLPWSIGLGICLSAFWLTREEGMWLMPSMGLLLICAAIAAAYEQRKKAPAALAMLALPLVIWGGALASVSLLNLHYYGFFGVVESKAAPLEKAYGALVRVTPVHEERYIPVPREARLRIYAVSKAFAQLRPYLEGSVGAGWQNTSEFFERRSHGDIAGGWFIFALREAVVQAGYDHSPRQEMAFYKRLAHQVNDACDRGLLVAGRRRVGFGPRIDRNSIPWIWNSGKRALLWALTLPNYASSITPPNTPPDLVEDMENFTGSLAEPVRQTTAGGWAFSPKWGSLNLSLVATDGTVLPCILDRAADDGLYQHFLALGHDWPGARNARFSLSTADPRPCSLVVRAGNKLLGSYSLQKPISYIEGPDLCMSIDSINLNKTVVETTSLDTLRYRALDAIAGFYQLFLRWLSALAVLMLIIEAIAFFLGRRDSIFLLGICLLGAVICRLGVVALLDATSFPAVNLSYLASLFPPLLMFVGVSLAWPFSVSNDAPVSG